MAETYAATAEFYDLLQATQHLALAERLTSRWLGTPTVGVLDVGAGTGIATEILAMSTSVPVHAIEPAAPMRTVLLSRLAGRSALLNHVRVHAAPIQDLGLSGIADAAMCLNTMGCLDAPERSAVLGAIASALVPGGVLVVQRPPERLAAESRPLPAWSLGGDVYDGEVTGTPNGPHRLRWRFTYRVRRDGAVIREVHEDFAGYLVSHQAFAAELAEAGFTRSAADDPDIVIAHRV
jgi:SAM-dependent methyltransferase